VSASFDQYNGRIFIKDSQGDTADIGDINRARYGADLYYKIWNFELSGEYLIVKNFVPSAIQDSLNLWSSQDPYFIGNSLDKKFYYATLLYNITDNLFCYVMWDYLNDEINPYYFGLDGYYGYHFGGGYNINDNIVLKFQYNKNFSRFDTGEDVFPIRKYYENIFTIGVSFTF
jgi:hypothetical protein